MQWLILGLHLIHLIGSILQRFNTSVLPSLGFQGITLSSVPGCSFSVSFPCSFSFFPNPEHSFSEFQSHSFKVCLYDFWLPNLHFKLRCRPLTLDSHIHLPNGSLLGYWIGNKLNWCQNEHESPSTQNLLPPIFPIFPVVQTEELGVIPDSFLSLPSHTQSTRKSF